MSCVVSISLAYKAPGLKRGWAAWSSETRQLLPKRHDFIAIVASPAVTRASAEDALDLLHGTQSHTDPNIVWVFLLGGYYIIQERIFKKLASM